MFFGFPRISEIREPITITANGGSRRMTLSVSLGLFAEERLPDGIRRLVPQQAELFGGAELIPALVIEGLSTRRVMPLDMLRRAARGRVFGAEMAENPRLPCVMVSPYGGESTTSLGPLWDKIALSERENDVVEALRIVAPDIKAVSMVGGDNPRRIRTAIVRSQSFPRPVPLRSFGDGLNRLFGIVLSLVNAKDGLLLIDEFENGMHHTVQYDVWRGIFRLSRALKVQVFATSHSWDAIQAFQRAAAEDPDDGVLVRLSKRNEDIIPTLFREEELAVATRDHIEVR
jgi:hypothetical protein